MTRKILYLDRHEDTCDLIKYFKNEPLPECLSFGREVLLRLIPPSLYQLDSGSVYLKIYRRRYKKLEIKNCNLAFYLTDETKDEDVCCWKPVDWKGLDDLATSKFKVDLHIDLDVFSKEAILRGFKNYDSSTTLTRRFAAGFESPFYYGFGRLTLENFEKLLESLEFSLFFMGELFNQIFYSDQAIIEVGLGFIAYLIERIAEKMRCKIKLYLLNSHTFQDKEWESEVKPKFLNSISTWPVSFEGYINTKSLSIKERLDFRDELLKRVYREVAIILGSTHAAACFCMDDYILVMDKSDLKFLKFLAKNIF